MQAEYSLKAAQFLSQHPVISSVATTALCCYSVSKRVKQDQTGLDRSARSTLDFGAKGLKVSRSQGLKVSRSQGFKVEAVTAVTRVTGRHR